MIIITSRLFDAESPIVLEEDPGGTRVHNATRRLSRSATLDGGVVIDDGGYSEGDRDMSISVSNPSAGVVEHLQSLQQGDGFPRVATREGVFECGFNRLSYEGGELSLDFHVRSNLCAAG